MKCEALMERSQDTDRDSLWKHSVSTRSGRLAKMRKRKSQAVLDSKIKRWSSRNCMSADQQTIDLNAAYASQLTIPLPRLDRVSGMVPLPLLSLYEDSVAATFLLIGQMLAPQPIDNCARKLPRRRVRVIQILPDGIFAADDLAFLKLQRVNHVSPAVPSEHRDPIVHPAIRLTTPVLVYSLHRCVAPLATWLCARRLSHRPVRGKRPASPAAQGTAAPNNRGYSELFSTLVEVARD